MYLSLKLGLSSKVEVWPSFMGKDIFFVLIDAQHLPTPNRLDSLSFSNIGALGGCPSSRAAVPGRLSGRTNKKQPHKKVKLDAS